MKPPHRLCVIDVRKMRIPIIENRNFAAPVDAAEGIRLLHVRMLAQHQDSRFISSADRRRYR